METRIGIIKPTKGNLKIEKSGTDGIRLTIEVPKKIDISIIVDKFELLEALKQKGGLNSSQP